MNSLHLSVLLDYAKSYFYKARDFYVKHNVSMWLLWYGFCVLTIPPAAIVYAFLIGKASAAFFITLPLWIYASLLRTSLVNSNVKK